MNGRSDTKLTEGDPLDLKMFRASIDREQPPSGITVPLRALWYDAKGDWSGAHDALQGQPDDGGAAWVHAYLHRVEGDLANARYWYSRAGRPASDQPLQTEWDEIAKALLAQT